MRKEHRTPWELSQQLPTGTDSWRGFVIKERECGEVTREDVYTHVANVYIQRDEAEEKGGDNRC